MPYSFAINSLCSDPMAFLYFKDTQRELLGFSKMKDPEFLKQKEEEREKLLLRLRWKMQGYKTLTADQVSKMFKW